MKDANGVRLLYVIDHRGEDLALVFVDERGHCRVKPLTLSHAAQLMADLARGVTRRMAGTSRDRATRAPGPGEECDRIGEAPRAGLELPQDWEGRVVALRRCDPNSGWPFTSHRTMAEIIADETLGDPA